MERLGLAPGHPQATLELFSLKPRVCFESKPPAWLPRSGLRDDPLIFLDATEAGLHSSGKAGTQPFGTIPKPSWSRMDLTSLGPGSHVLGLPLQEGGDPHLALISWPTPPSRRALGLPVESSPHTPVLPEPNEGTEASDQGPAGGQGSGARPLGPLPAHH